jgi:hypothetical protein
MSAASHTGAGLDETSLRQRVAAKLAAARARGQEAPTLPAPRYDEVFFEGVEWLNKL